MRERRQALVLLNPNARRGAEPIEPVLERLRGSGIDPLVERFGCPTEVSPDIVRRKAEVDLVIVCGGDGTLNAAARGVLDTGLPLGILPMGTGNDLARTLGLPLDLFAAADVIAADASRTIDIGEVNGHLFFNVASLGLSADLAKKLTKERKRTWGRLIYAFTAIKVLLTARRFEAEIVSRDGTVRVQTLQIAIGNGKHYAGGMTIEASAAIDDKHLDLYSLELGAVWKLALMAGDLKAGTHGTWSEVRTVRCTEFDVKTSRPRAINTDGELVTFTPARFRVLPDAVTVFAPPLRSDTGSA
jgi:YegS/Rv2252/BmrU family lipid kinase